MNAPLNALTVDVEEWFHVCGVGGALTPTPGCGSHPRRVDDADRCWKRLRGPACADTSSSSVGRRALSRLVEAIREAEHEIGSHGYQHERVYDLGPERFARDLRRSVQALHAVGVPRVTLFRAPEWSINDRSLWALEQLARNGFTLDSSMAPLKSSARSPTRVIRISDTLPPDRSSRCRRLSPTDSARRCRWDGAGASV